MRWIDDIIEHVCLNYNNRKIVLWGKYKVSDEIKEKLEKKHGLEVAFYVDKDTAKIDHKQVYPTNYLQGKAAEYYVVVPVAYYPSIKEELTGGGYLKDKDYYYFCDCIVKDTPDYYEDTHGNKIIGLHQGCKCAFSGFNSVVKIGKDSKLSGSVFYIHSDAEVEIGENCRIQEVNFHIEDGAKLKISNRFTTAENCEFLIKKETTIIVGEDCMFSRNIYLRTNDGHSIFDVRTGKNINSVEEMRRGKIIFIGNHVWIGERSTILYNTEIGDGSIIGAGSLVKSKIPNNCIAAGVPAKVIRKDVAWSRDDCADELKDSEKKYNHLTKEI